LTFLFGEGAKRGEVKMIPEQPEPNRAILTSVYTPTLLGYTEITYLPILLKVKKARDYRN
jgi:hypothetical protein